MVFCKSEQTWLLSPELVSEVLVLQGHLESIPQPKSKKKNVSDTTLHLIIIDFLFSYFNRRNSSYQIHRGQEYLLSSGTHSDNNMTVL